MATKQHHPQLSLLMTQLQRNALFVLISHGTIITFVFLILSRLYNYSGAFSWFVISCLLCLFIHIQLWLNLKFNHSPGDARHNSTLGLANNITLTRGLLLCLIAGMYPSISEVTGITIISVGYIAGTTYIIASCLDGIDGFVARKKGLVTLLGERLDTRIDALGILIASLLAIRLGRIPDIYILTGLVYYLFIAGKWYRKIRGNALVPLQFRPFARLIAGVQMGFLGAALLPILPDYPIQLAAVIFMTPLLLGFIWDWLVVSGHSQKKELIILPHLTQKVITLIQINSRIAVCITGISLLFSNIYTGSLVVVSWIGILLMICVGLCGRLAALTAAIIISFAFPEHNPSYVLQILFCSLLLIFLFGSGPYSVYSPEESLFQCEPKSTSTA